MKTFFTRAAFSLALLPVATFASEREHGAHEHGHVILQIVQEGGELHIAMQSPAANIVGFEHQAESDSDKLALSKAEKLLGNSEALFAPNDSAGCVAETAVVESELLEEHDEHGEHEKEHDDHKDEHDEHDEDHDDHKDDHDKHDHDEHSEETHSEFHAEYHYECSAPGKLEYIDVNLFSHFSSIEEIDVQIATTGGQTSVELEPGDTRVTLP